MFSETIQPVSIEQPGAGPLARVAVQLHQLVCGLHGHDTLLHFEDGRMSLQCGSCGYETPGWDVRPHRESKPDRVAASARVIRMPLLGERRVA